MGADDIRYLTVADVMALYEVAMKESGQGSAPLVREDALQSAVHHPRNLGYYENASLAMQAVELMLYIALAHSWVDGNKRISALSLYAFLAQNGVKPPDETSYRSVADKLISWIAASQAERDAIRDDLVALVESWGN